MVSCGSDEGKDVPEIDLHHSVVLDEDRLLLGEVKAISCDSVYLRYPYRVEIKDSLAVILDLHPDSCFLHAFTYPEWRYVTSFGRRGEGPEEVLSAERVRICSSDSVWVLDSNRRQITRWRISASLGNAERAEEILLEERLIRTLDFCKTDEGFLVTDYTGNPKGIKGFNDVVVSDSCIYAVFDGIPFKDRISAFRSGKKQPEGGKHVYVFGLDGKQKEIGSY